MFAIIGHINFGITLNEFETIWLSIIGVLKISIGVYEFGMYQKQIDEGVDITTQKVVMLDVFIFIIAAICKILLLN